MDVHNFLPNCLEGVTCWTKSLLNTEPRNGKSPTGFESVAGLKNSSI